VDSIIQWTEVMRGWRSDAQSARHAGTARRPQPAPRHNSRFLQYYLADPVCGLQVPELSTLLASHIAADGAGIDSHDITAEARGRLEEPLTSASEAVEVAVSVAQADDNGQRPAIQSSSNSPAEHIDPETRGSSPENLTAAPPLDDRARRFELSVQLRANDDHCRALAATASVAPRAPSRIASRSRRA